MWIRTWHFIVSLVVFKPISLSLSLNTRSTGLCFPEVREIKQSVIPLSVPGLHVETIAQHSSRVKRCHLSVWPVFVQWLNAIGHFIAYPAFIWLLLKLYPWSNDFWFNSRNDLMKLWTLILNNYAAVNMSILSPVKNLNEMLCMHESGITK